MNSTQYSKIIITLIFFFNLGACADVKNLSSEELMEAQKKGVMVIDIRTPEEWKKYGTIAGAKRIMFYDKARKPKIPEFMAEFENVVTDKSQAFILVCRTGSRTSRVKEFLAEKKGYMHGSHLAKGMKKWVEEGLPVEK